MGTYVVGDIHGCYDEWIQFKNSIEEQDNNAKFILVGDIIDRGQKILEMIQWAMKNITSDGKYQMVIGNHEDEKISWWKECKKYVEQEGELKSILNFYPDRYDFQDIFIENNLGIEEINTVINWFSTLPYYKDIQINDKRFIIAHADIPYSIIRVNTETDEHILKDNDSLSNKDKEFIVWSRDIDGFKKIPNTILIHGHTPTITSYAFSPKDKNKVRGKIHYTHNRINVDCGLVFKYNDKNANLAAIRLEDLKEYYLY